MPGGQYIALSAMQTRLDELDRLSADIANASTAGYKAERTSQLEADRPSFDATLQTAIDVAGGERRLDMRTGAINPTGRDLDLAIEGSGFFTVQTPAGARYTRNGQFTRSTDGTLTTADGAAVMGTSGSINVGTSGGKISVDPDGTVRSATDVAGKLAIVEFDDPAQLVRDGGATLRADGLTPTPSASASVRAG
ncbi:MAG: flagellar hook-basal body protein, partial [Vicinamibacterales bacterium]